MTNVNRGIGESVRILGIDPGLNITGYGVIEISDHGPQLVEGGVIRTVQSQSLPQKLAELYAGIIDAIESLHPTVMSIEELYSHYQRPRTAILMGHARGVLALAGEQKGLDIHHYAATQIKRVLTGNGRAPKSQVQMAVVNQLDLDTTPEPPDVADALAIALCHCFLSTNPQLK